MISEELPGDPPKIALLHGFTGAAASWDPIVERLPLAGSESLRLDLLGHGTATPLDSVQSFGQEACRIADQLAEETELLVGYSMGARVALGLLLQRPRAVRRAVLIGVNPGLTDATERQLRVEHDERWAQRLETERLEAFIAAWERLPLFADQAQLPSSRQAHQTAIRRAQDPRGLARALRLLGLGTMPDYWPQLPTLETPVTLVVGEWDDRFRRIAERFAAVALRARVIVVPRTHHNPLLSDPEFVANLIFEEWQACRQQ